MIDEQSVLAAAALAGIEIPARHLTEVVANLQRTAEVAAFVNAAPMDPMDDELAPVWRP